MKKLLLSEKNEKILVLAGQVVLLHQNEKYGKLRGQ